MYYIVALFSMLLFLDNSYGMYTLDFTIDMDESNEKPPYFTSSDRNHFLSHGGADLLAVIGRYNEILRSKKVAHELNLCIEEKIYPEDEIREYDISIFIGDSKRFAIASAEAYATPAKSIKNNPTTTCHLPATCHLNELWIKTLYRKRGLGSLIVNFLQEPVLAKHCYEYEVIKLASLASATGFYEKLGFTRKHLNNPMLIYEKKIKEA